MCFSGLGGEGTVVCGINKGPVVFWWLKLESANIPAFLVNASLLAGNNCLQNLDLTPVALGCQYSNPGCVSMCFGIFSSVGCSSSLTRNAGTAVWIVLATPVVCATVLDWQGTGDKHDYWMCRKGSFEVHRINRY